MNTLNIKKIKIFAVVLICAFTLQSTAQTNKNFSISGSLKNMTVMPVKLYLNYDPVAKKPVDSAIVINGEYAFKGSVDVSVPAVVSLTAGGIAKPGNTDQYSLMLDNGTLNLVSEQNLAHTTVSGNGALANTEFHKVRDYGKAESAELNKMIQSEAFKTSDSLKKVVTNRTSDLLGSKLVFMIDYVRANPKSPASPYLTYSLLAMGFLTPEMTDTISHTFPAELRSSVLGLAIDSIFAKKEEAKLAAIAKRKALDEIIPLGSKAIEFTQNDVKGNPVSLSSYKGKYVLIDFWASWCKPCRAENPNVVKAYNTYKNKGFTVLGVSLDAASQKDKWLEAIQHDGLPWTQVSDLMGGKNAAAKLYGVEAIPQNFLVDPNGVIIAKNLRGEDLELKLKQIFK